MAVKSYIFMGLFYVQSMTAAVLFQGLVEQSDVNKNTFLCPTSAADGIQGCVDTQNAAHGFDVSGGRTIQFCNNQQYWLQQETIQAQYLATGRNYTGDDLTAQLKAAGWTVMGGYAIIISSNPLLTDMVMPQVKAGNGQTKVIAQLLYNGSNLIQLWSQDAMVFSQGQSFTITISSAADVQLPQLLAGAATVEKSWKDLFLSQLDIQPNNRKDSDYNSAIGSPRQIRFTLSAA